LDLNEKDKDGYFSLYWTIVSNNIEIFQLLLEYFNQNHINLNLNEKSDDGDCPLDLAILYKNIEVVQLLIKYALQHQIIWKCENIELLIKNKPKIKNLLLYYEKEK